ncbi:MAG: type II methionyl aminopeptidase [Chlamydiales bacterium]|nr:type II methionyl aminopeptidase [Chlamydiales bacterium]
MDQSYKRNFIRAGAIAKEVRAYGKSLIVPGASYNAVINQINAKIHELGARPAFPPQIAMNDVAAHYLPYPDEDIIFSVEVVKLDVGVCFQGAIGDCAVSIDLSGQHQKLIEAAEAALLAAEKSIKVGQPLREVGRIIDETARSYGLKPIQNLSGHGLGVYKIHTPPMIPNYDNRSKVEIKPGMTFAIEPFVTDGAGLIYEVDEPTIFAFVKNQPLRTDNAKKLLTRIKEFAGLPFAIHDLISAEMPLDKVRKGLGELLKTETITGYGPLLEKDRGMVAQAENSVLVDDDGTVIITTR